MKRITLILLLVTTYVSNAQIEIIEKPIIEISSLWSLALDGVTKSLSKDSADNSYFVSYRDASNTDIPFLKRPMKKLKIGERESVVELREVMLNLFIKKQTDLTIKMGETVLKFKRNGKRFTTLITYANGTSGVMGETNKSQVKKIFPIDVLE